MRLALTVDWGARDQLVFAKQLGVEQVVVETAEWRPQALEALVRGVEEVDLDLAGCAWIGLGSGQGSDARRPGQDAEALRRAIVAAGAAGIPQVHLVWDGHEVEAVLRTAEDARVRLAWQVGPPALSEALSRLSALDPGDGHGLEITLEPCHTTAEAVATVRSGQGRIVSILLANRAISGPCALDEGAIELPVVLRELGAIGFEGPVRAVGGPDMVGDTAWGHERKAFDLGYIRSVLQALS